MISRRATVADAAGVAALERALFGADAWSLPMVVAELSDEHRFAVVSVVGDETVGYAMTMRADDVADLIRVAVHPSYRRRGIARTLLAAVVEHARAGGARRMLLEVGSGNDPAIAFYTGDGFVEIDRRPRYYRGGGDALVMCRTLDGPSDPTERGGGE